MTIYYLFGGSQFYPQGGAADYVGNFTDLHTAQEWGQGFEWANIATVNDTDLACLFQWRAFGWNQEATGGLEAAWLDVANEVFSPPVEPYQKKQDD